MYLIDGVDNTSVREAFFSQTRCVDAKAEILDSSGNVIKTLDTDSHIISMQIVRGIQTEDAFIGCAISKEYTMTVKDEPMEMDFTNAAVKPYIGVKLGEKRYFAPFPAGEVHEAKFDAVKKTWNIVCYDDMQKFNGIALRDAMPQEGKLTLREYAGQICMRAGVPLDEGAFFNEDMIIGVPNFSGDEYLREVISRIAQAALSNAVINRDGKLEFIPVTKPFHEGNDVLLSPGEYFAFEKKETFGPINTVVLARAETEDNIFYPPEEDRAKVYIDEAQTMTIEEHIALHGVNELKIFDNPFLDQSTEDVAQDTRAGLIEKLFHRIKGREYASYELQHRGVPFIDEGDRFRIKDPTGNVTETLYFGETLTFNGGLRAASEGKAINGTATDYDRASSVKELLKNTQIKVDKHEGSINHLTRTIGTMGENLENNYITTEQTNLLVQNASEGVTNLFARTGGANYLRNSAPFFGEGTHWEYWDGSVGRVEESDSKSGYAFLLKKGKVSQEISLPNGIYSLGFKYKVLNPAASAGIIRCYGQTIDLLEQREEQAVHKLLSITSEGLNIEMESDIDDAFEIYDLMLNTGEVSKEWAQNINETISDTVNISKGIEVTSNTTKTKTRLDSDGFRVLDTSGQVILRATYQDENANVETAYLTSLKGAQISGLSVQNVDGEVWISGI